MLEKNFHRKGAKNAKKKEILRLGYVINFNVPLIKDGIVGKVNNL